MSTLTLHFAQPLFPRQLKEFNDFIGNLAYRHEDLLLLNGIDPDIFTNKTLDGKNISRYPLVQCKIIRRYAVITGIGEGAKAVKILLPHFGTWVTLSETTFNLAITDIQQTDHEFKKLRKPKTYHLYHWLALNRDNLKLWNEAHTLANKIPLMEKILYGQINNLLERVTGKEIKTLKNTILDINYKNKTKYREFENFVEFEIVFESNVNLPAEVGLGLGKSVGFGKLIPQGYYKNAEPLNHGAKHKEKQLQTVL